MEIAIDRIGFRASAPQYFGGIMRKKREERGHQ
jgi:hypothetical protein